MAPEAAEMSELVDRRRVPRLAVGLGVLLALSGIYLAALLFGFVFEVGGIRRHHVESASYIFVAAWLLTAATRSAAVPSTQNEHRTTRWMPAAAIATAALLYATTLSMGLFSDDFVLLQKALDREWMAQAEFVRPVPLVVWNFLVTITGTSAVLHALNIGLHALNATLVYSLARRLGLDRSRAGLAAVLFAAFPASVEAVAWPAAVHDLLVTACALLFVLLARRPRSWPHLTAAVFVLIVGLLSKESAVAIPVIAAVIWFGRGSNDNAAAWRVPVIGLAVCAVYGLARMALVAVPDSFAQEPTRYVLKELIARPMGTLIIPWNTAVLQAWPAVPFLWATGCVLAATTYAWSTVKAVPLQVVLRCIVAAYVAVLPVYSMLFITPDLENARYLYLSTAFWTIALVALASPSERLTRGRTLALATAIIVAVAGVQVHLTSWRDAARVRERVLAAAVETLKKAPCTPVSFVGAPDSARGAYVFRNGLAEAIGFRTGARPAPPTRDCMFAWNGSEFERSSDVRRPIQASVVR